MDNKVMINREIVENLIKREVNILSPQSVIIGEDVNLENIEPGVVIGPGTKILGSKTKIGKGTEIQGSAVINNCSIGRDCSLSSGEYTDSVFLDGCSTVGWARIRGHSAWEEESNSAHNVDTKTTILGYKSTLGSLINFCNVLMLGGTSPRLEVGAEVGSGTINFNFLPFGASVGVLIKPSTVIGSMESPFLACQNAPTRFVFIGGHTSIIAPVVIGLGTIVAAKTRVNPKIYEDNQIIGGGNIEKVIILDVNRVKVLKDMTTKYNILCKQISTALSFRKWFELRLTWAQRNGIDNFELQLLTEFTAKIDKFIEALETYGNNISKYLLASDNNSRSESLETNKKLALFWKNEIKEKIKIASDDDNSFKTKTNGLNEELDSITQKTSTNNLQFYHILSKLDFSSTEVNKAKKYFIDLSQSISLTFG